MFGKLIDISENTITVENLSKEIESNILNVHVVFTENDRQIIGEIIKINIDEIKILIIGEIKNGEFHAGVLKLPSMKSSCRIIYKSEVEGLIGSQDYASKKTLLIGNSTIYEGYKITSSMNDFFSNHFAIIGNSGTGKSCGVARIIQNIFYYNNEAIPELAHIVLFDVYGEYHSSFEKLNKVPGIHVKNYTTETSGEINNIISIPPYFLDVDDLAILLDVNDESLIPVLEKALQYVYIFKSEDPKSIEYKNDIIAKCLLDILSSGKSPSQIRDQIMSILTKYHTDTLNLESLIVQPGYTRTLRQCLNIDAQGKINAIQFVVDYLSVYTKVDLEDQRLGDNFIYDLDDLYYAFEFALLSEGTFTSTSIYEKANSLKVRLHAIINSDMKKFFQYPEVIGKEDYIKKMFQNENLEEVQVVNMNFNFIENRFAKILTKIFSRLFFEFTTKLKVRGSYPIHIILEEAHRYVNNDNDLKIIGYNIFDRITKEGRKYGLIMGFITQRPSELSSTSLSQCSNFIVLRMFHPEDLKIIASISANVLPKDLERIKTLRPGMCMVFGSAFKIPLITALDLPDPMPSSSNINITKTWFPE